MSIIITLGNAANTATFSTVDTLTSGAGGDESGANKQVHQQGGGGRPPTGDEAGDGDRYQYQDADLGLREFQVVGPARGAHFGDRQPQAAFVLVVVGVGEDIQAPRDQLFVIGLLCQGHRALAVGARQIADCFHRSDLTGDINHV